VRDQLSVQARTILSQAAKGRAHAVEGLFFGWGARVPDAEIYGKIMSNPFFFTVIEGFNRQIGDIIAEKVLKKFGDFIDSVVLYLFHVDLIVGYVGKPIEFGSTCRWKP